MYSMTIQLQTDTDKCLYEQIYEHIVREIKEGRLLAGEKLPSTRSMAEYLQISRSTVEFAYDQLLSEGYIMSEPYRGFFVCEIEELLGDAMTEPEQSLAAERENASERERDISWRYDFSPNGMDMSAFPYSVWKKITKNILNDGNQELFSHGRPQGDEDLRITISRYLYASRGVQCVPQQIVIGAGNDYLLLLLQKILGEHRTVAMENPTYIRACRIFQAMQYEILPVEMDESGMKPDKQKMAAADLAYVMPSHQFPTGTVMPIKRRTELLGWAYQRAGRYLIEDDYDSEFRYHGKPIPSLQGADTMGRVIYIGTFSKAIAPAIRVSYMVLPMELLERYYRDCSIYSCTVSRIDQRILNEFIRDGYFERYLHKMRKRYKIKHDLMLSCLEDFAPQFTVSGENAGLHIVVTAKTEVSERDLADRAAERGIKVYGMSDYTFLDTPKKPSLLLGFGGLSDQDIIDGIAELKKSWLS